MQIQIHIKSSSITHPFVYSNFINLSKGSIHGLGQAFQASHQVLKLFDIDLLGGVGEGVFGVRMNLQEQTISAGGHGGQAHGFYHILMAGAVGGIDNNG